MFDKLNSIETKVSKDTVEHTIKHKSGMDHRGEIHSVLSGNGFKGGVDGVYWHKDGRKAFVDHYDKAKKSVVAIQKPRSINEALEAMIVAKLQD